jgi:hypothetical protein
MTDDGFQLPMLLKVILVEDWHACQSTIAHLAFRSTETAVLVPLDDPSGLINADALAEEDGDGNIFIPKGSICSVARSQDCFDGHYELVHSGIPNCPSGSSGESSGSSSHEECFPVTGNALHFPIDAEPDFVLGKKIKPDGSVCWVWVPTVNCGSGSG